MTAEEIRCMFAATALQAMMQGQISRDEIHAMAQDESNGCPFVEAAWKCADKMMEHVDVGSL